MNPWLRYSGMFGLFVTAAIFVSIVYLGASSFWNDGPPKGIDARYHGITIGTLTPDIQDQVIEQGYEVNAVNVLTMPDSTGDNMRNTAWMLCVPFVVTGVVSAVALETSKSKGE